MARPAPAVGTAVVLDIETTGFNPRCDEILELAITLFRYDRIAGHVLEAFGSIIAASGRRCGRPILLWHTVRSLIAVSWSG
jgi:hypothetical protein